MTTSIEVTIESVPTIEFVFTGGVINAGGGSGSTNLGYTASPTDGTVTSDTGNDATVPLADGTNAGLLAPADFTKLGNQSGTNTGDQDLSVIVSDAVYGSGWNGDTTHAPSKNAVYDKIETLGAGATNLGYTPSPTDGTVTSDTGNDATVPLADGTNAGLLKPADFTKLSNTSGTNTGDQDLSGLVPKSIGTGKGDLIGFSASGTPVHILAGSDGQIPTYDSTATSGIRPITNTFNRIGSFIFAGHSWLVYGGAGGDEQSRRAEGVAGRFASMENISTTEVISLGRSGAGIMDDLAFPYAGWPALQQLLVPPANQRHGLTYRTPSAPYTAQPGGLFLLYGINDSLRDSTLGWSSALAGYTRGGYRAFKNALRAAIVARRAGGTFEHDDVARSFSDGVTTNSSTSITSASGAGFTQADVGRSISGTNIQADTRIITVTSATAATISRAATGSGSSLTLTIAGRVAYSGFATTVTTSKSSGTGYRKSVTNGDTFTVTLPDDFPGGTFAVQLIGTADTNTVLGAAIASSGATSITISAFGAQTVTNGSLVICDSEQMLVTAGAGTTSLTVTRGVNGTTATTHSNGVALLGVNATTVNWSGTCTGATGSSQVSAQGCANATLGTTGTVPVVKRFTGLTAADAGRTIIGTVASVPTTAGEQFVGFDCAKVEAPVPGPIVVCNAAKYAYGSTWSLNTDAVVTELNTAMAAVVAEFDSTVAVADVATEFAKYGGTLGAAMTDTTGTSATITAGSIGPQAGEFIRIGTEDMFVTAVSGSTYTVVRGVNSTTAATHLNGATVYNRSLYSLDNVHPSSYGQRVLAGLLKTTFGTMSLTSAQLNEANGYYRVEPQTLRNSSYLTSRGGRGRLLGTDQKATAMSITLNRPVVLTALACEVLTAGGSGSVTRLAIIGDNGGGYPNWLVWDGGTVSTTSTGKKEVTGRVFLNPGVYWLAACPQGAGSPAPVYRSLIELDEGLQPTGTGDFTGDVFGSGSLKVNGTGTFTNVTTSQTFAHGLPITPTTAEMQAGLIINGTSAIASNNFATRWVESADATNFSIRFATAPTTGQTFAWSFDGTQCQAEFAKTGFTGTGISGIFADANVSVLATPGEAILVAAKIETVEPV